MQVTVAIQRKYYLFLSFQKSGENKSAFLLLSLCVQPEYFGNVIVVNGKAWPYLKVERRKYRFRIVNVSNARFFRFALHNGLPFTQIASDSNYLPAPVLVRDFLLAPSEQADVVIDFSKSATDEIILMNSAVYPFPSGDVVNNQNSKVMKFILETQKYSSLDQVKQNLIPQRFIPLPDVRREKISNVRHITLLEYESKLVTPTHLLLNGLPYDAPVTETPKAGSTEIWHVINLTEDNHPVHLHFADFLILHQEEVNNPETLELCIQAKGLTPCNMVHYIGGHGQKLRPPVNERGWKNVVKCNPGHMTTIFARFGLVNNEPLPFNASAEPGYAYHCHVSVPQLNRHRYF